MPGMASFANLTGKTEPGAHGSGATGAGVPTRTIPAPVHYVPPTPREIRAQAVHRLQVGLFGLGGMLLLVSLANVIMDRAQLADEDVASAESPASTSAPANDPLADMGVAPELPVAQEKEQPRIVIPTPTTPPPAEP